MLLFAATAVARADMARERFDRAALHAPSPERVSALVVTSACRQFDAESAARAITLDRPIQASAGATFSPSALLFRMAYGMPAAAASQDAERSAQAGHLLGDPASPGNTFSLPPAPDGDTLCLSGLLSLGALQTLRRARHVHLHLPEWYHADAAHHQVGHTVALDPTLGVSLQAVCPFELPSDLNRPTVLRQRPCDIPLRCESQSTLLTEAPRGPPTN